MDRITGFDKRNRDGAKHASINGARVVSRQVVACSLAPRLLALGLARDDFFTTSQLPPLRSCACKLSC